MSEEIRILQLGDEDWSSKYRLPEKIEYFYAESFVQTEEKPYDLVFLDRTPKEEEIDPLRKVIKAYSLYVTESVVLSDRGKWLYAVNKGQRLPAKDIQRFLLEEVKFYYPHPYGEKFKPGNIAIAQGFSGKVTWNGSCSVVLEGDFGEEFNQAVFWRNNIPIFQGKVIEFWLEYKKTPGIDISMVVTQFSRGSISNILKRWVFSEEELSQLVLIDSESQDSTVFVSLHARGRGEIQVIALHDRNSRGSHGCFLPGGERYVTSEREEVFCYFDPGDLKPPLNVYFSGYKTRQGFEGYYMMKKMGSPFLLMAEPRLEGGSFYVGSGEYEKLETEIIRAHMKELGFTSDQVILSGISMGSCGALYCGCTIRPHALILGKPVASLGTIVANHRYLPPKGANPLDLLLALEKDTDQTAVKSLDAHFWEKFDAADWGKTKFILAYMIEDEVDPEAYPMLLSHLHTSGVQVYGKGLHGRHNDNTAGIVGWFRSQYRKVLQEDFLREVER